MKRILAEERSLFLRFLFETRGEFPKSLFKLVRHEKRDHGALREFLERRDVPNAPCFVVALCTSEASQEIRIKKAKERCESLQAISVNFELKCTLSRGLF